MLKGGHMQNRGEHGTLMNDLFWTG